MPIRPVHEPSSPPVENRDELRPSTSGEETSEKRANNAISTSPFLGSSYLGLPGSHSYGADSVMDTLNRRLNPLPTEGHIQPNNGGQLEGYDRPTSMGTNVTKRMLNNEADSGENKKIMQVDTDPTNPNSQGMRQLGLSRNHIISDASTAHLLTEAHTNVTPGSDGHNALNNFISTLAPGSRQANRAIGAFQRSLEDPTAAQGSLKQTIRATSEGQDNLRFDDAQLNGVINHGADYELTNDGSKVSDRSVSARDSVMNLARRGAVQLNSAFNAVQPTIKYTGKRIEKDVKERRGQYASSSQVNPRYDPAAKWGDMQDPETLNPRTPDHFGMGDGGPSRPASTPPDLPSDKQRRTNFLNDE